MLLKTSVRNFIYKTEKYFQKIKFRAVPQSELPALLGISFPKSGTHLLDQILLGFANHAPFSKRLHSFYAEYEGESGKKREPEKTLQWLDALQPGDIASAHLFSRPLAIEKIISKKFISYFIFRDPRDVVVSHVFYVTEMETRHVHHAHYAALPDFNARLNASILGIPNSAVEFPNIAERFAPYLGWLNHKEVLPIHFEDLINSRAEALTRIADHLLNNYPLHTPRELILASLEEAIHPKRSPTFRSGKTGEWKNHFTDEHKRIFKDGAGDLLIQLGYEKNNDW